MLRSLKTQIINTSAFTMQKNLSNYFFKYPYGASCWKLLKTQKKKEQSHFYKKVETKLTNCHAELFFRTKKLEKTEPRATAVEYIKRTYSRRRGSQRQFVDSYSKTERKISKRETKILTHALGLSEEQS